MKNSNINKAAVLPVITEVVNSFKLSLYEVNINNEFENEVLQILIEKNDGSSVDFDELSGVNEEVSKKLDDLNLVNDQYILEVSSAGIEKQIKSKEQLIKNVGSYVFVKFATVKKSGEFSGDYVSYENDQFNFKFFDKGQPKKISLLWDEIEFIRFAINFKNI